VDTPPSAPKVCNDWYARGEASRAPDLGVYNKAFFWVSPLADFPESLAFRVGKILMSGSDCA